MSILTFEERDRRWKSIREAMSRRGLECLIIWGSYGRFRHFGANLKYLANISAEGYMLFPLMADPTLVMFFGRPDPTAWVSDLRTGHPSYSAVITERLRELHLERGTIGIVGASGYDGEMGFPLAAHTALTGNLPKARFEDATGILAAARIIKSTAEIHCLELGCEIADKVIQTVARAARPGVKDYEVRATLMDALFREGCEPDAMLLYHAGNALLHAGQGGQLKPPGPKVLEAGDVILTEFDAAFLGYIAQYNQPFCIGTPDKEWQEVFDLAAECFNVGLEVLKPGVTTGALYEAMIAPVRRAGFHTTNPAFHGLGLALENPISVFPAQPLYKPDLSLEFRSGMVVGFEPHVIRPDFKKGASLGSPVLVTETGCRMLSKQWKPEARIA